jgi:hypothetical protein
MCKIGDTKKRVKDKGKREREQVARKEKEQEEKKDLFETPIKFQPIIFSTGRNFDFC